MENAQFVDDISIDNALTGILLRSPVVSGRLIEIKPPPLPDDISIVTHTAVPGLNACALGQPNNESGKTFQVPLFAEKEIAWYGQPLALLLGYDANKLCQIAQECEIIVEEYPVNELKTVILERDYHSGDITEAFEKADKIIEGTYTAEIQDPWPPDTPGAIAVPGQGNSLTIHTATQWPGHVRLSVARCLNIKPALVQVETSRMGIHLDSKIWTPSFLACQAAVGARLSGKPVKLVLKREEDFLYSSKSVHANIYIQSAIDKQGGILGSKVKISADFGAAGLFTGEILDRIALGALGSYNHGSAHLEALALSSAIPPAGPFGGFGFAQGFFAGECHASRIADSVEENPAEWRKKFFLAKGKKLAIGAEIEAPPHRELLDTVTKMSFFNRKWASYELLRKSRRDQSKDSHNVTEALRGIGIAVAYQSNSFLYDYRLPGLKAAEEGVELTLEKDGVLKIKIDFPCGNNQLKCWQLIANKILGVEKVELVSQEPERTKHLPDPGPACLSRGITLISSLVEKACTAIRKQRFRDPLPITVHRTYHTTPVPAWGSSGYTYDQNALNLLSWGAAVVETEIDPAAITPHIRGIWVTVDGGSIIEKDLAKKSININSIQALSFAMREMVTYNNGKNISSCKDYPLPGIEDNPPIDICFLDSGRAQRGIGELPYAVIPAAYAQSVTQAMDYSFRTYPVNLGITI